MNQHDWNQLLHLTMAAHAHQDTINVLRGLASGRLKIVDTQSPPAPATFEQVNDTLKKAFEYRRDWNALSIQHPHVNQMFEYLVDACDSQEPWRNWQLAGPMGNDKWQDCETDIKFTPGCKYRRKPAFHDFKIDDKCEFSNNGETWRKGYFGGVASDGMALCFPWGATSWTASSEPADAYTYCRKVSE